MFRTLKQKKTLEEKKSFPKSIQENVDKIFLKSKNAPPPFISFLLRGTSKDQQSTGKTCTEEQHLCSMGLNPPPASSWFPNPPFMGGWEGGRGEGKRLIISSDFRHVHVSTALRVALGALGSR